MGVRAKKMVPTPTLAITLQLPTPPQEAECRDDPPGPPFDACSQSTISGCEKVACYTNSCNMGAEITIPADHGSIYCRRPDSCHGGNSRLAIMGTRGHVMCMENNTCTGDNPIDPAVIQVGDDSMVDCSRNACDSAQITTGANGIVGCYDSSSGSCRRATILQANIVDCLGAGDCEDATVVAKCLKCFQGACAGACQFASLNNPKSFTACLPGQQGDCPKKPYITRRARYLMKDINDDDDDDAVVTTVEQGGDEYQYYVDTCGDFEYDVSIVVDTHFFGVAVPLENAVASGCPRLVTHAVFDDSSSVAFGDNYKKQVSICTNVKEFTSLFSGEDSLPVGTFKLSELVRAHENVDPNLDAERRAAYDIVSNNCAEYMIALASELNIKVDNRIISFVAARLLKHASRDFFKQIRTSLHLSGVDRRNLLRSESIGSIADKELIDMVVRKRVSEL